MRVSAHNRRARNAFPLVYLLAPVFSSTFLMANKSREDEDEFHAKTVHTKSTAVLVHACCPARGSTRPPLTMPSYPILLGIFALVLVVVCCLFQRRSSVDDHKIPKISTHLIVDNNDDAFQHHHPNISEGITYSRTMIDFAADGKFYCLGWFRLFFVVC